MGTEQETKEGGSSRTSACTRAPEELIQAISRSPYPRSCSQSVALYPSPRSLRPCRNEGVELEKRQSCSLISVSTLIQMQWEDEVERMPLDPLAL